MEAYKHQEIESKWQSIWEDKGLFHAVDFDARPKFYGLIEFPYPSGTGMHVGHVRAFSSLEVISRKRRMEGYNVLFPLGFDAFGLPTENYAIKTKIHPRVVTDRNIKTYLSQMRRAGFSFDLNRIVDTTQPEYYRWTQWIFLQLFHQGLAFKNKTFVNYCPSCQVVLANEESQGGKCDRCDSDVIQKQKDVWFLKITEYADALLKGLEHVDYSERIKTEQINWIGRSDGAEVHFQLSSVPDSLTIFTTRPDTLFGATFMVVAPEHPMLEKWTQKISNMKEIADYQQAARRKTEFERVQLNKDKTGVRIQGIEAMNPMNGKALPIFVSDYVMMGYGTGAIMAVPGHDARDYDFAKQYGLEIIEVIQGGNLEEAAYTSTEKGILINSDFLNGLDVKEAIEIVTTELEKRHLGHRVVQFKMKDWAFNRQRYWGEPIPIIHCPHCGQVPVPEDQLPVLLPQVEHFEPGENGESPLANIEDWVNVPCPKCGEMAKRETDTMPQWAGSSWYFLRYCDPQNHTHFASNDLMKYWLPVDWYNGGMEHVTRHMIYSRFWNHFLYDQGHVPVREPYAKRTAQGLILGSDNEKMSKSRGNVVDPLEIIESDGADSLRLYILFIGEYDQPTPWNENGLKGCRRFLERVWRLQEKINYSNSGYSPTFESMMHRTIKAVSEDIESMKFNTAIAKMMTLVNEWVKAPAINVDEFHDFLKILHPFAPHITEELHELTRGVTSLQASSWPSFDAKLAMDTEVSIAVQVNGKLRATFLAPMDEEQEVLVTQAKALPTVQVHLNDKSIVKTIVVPNRIVNFVVR